MIQYDEWDIPTANHFYFFVVIPFAVVLDVD